MFRSVAASGVLRRAGSLPGRCDRLVRLGKVSQSGGLSLSLSRSLVPHFLSLSLSVLYPFTIYRNPKLFRAFTYTTQLMHEVSLIPQAALRERPLQRCAACRVSEALSGQEDRTPTTKAVASTGRQSLARQ